MEAVVRYPVGEQSFGMLRGRDCLYVDKTLFVERLLDKGSKYYFLGRPRRFGKSLFLSMMECFFKGKREFFKGLYADGIDWDWEPHPVFYLDLNIQSYKDEGALARVLAARLERWEKEYGVECPADDLSVRFENLIRQAYEKTGKGVVILVDEYDKPLVKNLHDRKMFEHFRDELAAFYSNFKSSAAYIRMVFLTGVSRFAHLSVFSGLNNITDITFLDEYSDICGISESELQRYFQPGISSLAEKSGRTPDEIRLALKRQYDGYHFSKNSDDIYNPYSLLNVMESGEMNNFWSKSGVPTLLVEMLKRYRTDLKVLFETRCGQSTLEGLDFDSPNPVALLYQTGYLTIKDYNPAGIYTLGLPNLEVRESFLYFLLPRYSYIFNNDALVFTVMFREELERGDVDAFMERLQSMFASVPYEMNMDNVKNLQNALFILMYLLGIHIETEYRTSAGRIDLFMRTERYYYIMELKYDKTAQAALAQINERKYALPFGKDGREIVKIGVNFSSKTRTIDEWVAEYE